MKFKLKAALISSTIVVLVIIILVTILILKKSNGKYYEGNNGVEEGNNGNEEVNLNDQVPSSFTIDSITDSNLNDKNASYVGTYTKTAENEWSKNDSEKKLRYSTSSSKYSLGFYGEDESGSYWTTLIKMSETTTIKNPTQVTSFILNTDKSERLISFSNIIY